MAKAHLGKLSRFTTIGALEIGNVLCSLNHPLSEYIGGDPRGGYWIEHLTAKWQEEFGVRYAIPCNSATSGLLAACMAVGIGPGDEVWTTAYSMSATAACAKVLGADIRIIDIELECFGLDPTKLSYSGWTGRGKQPPKAVIVTNLFGHPAKLREIREWCDTYHIYMIEDNAQSPFAMFGQDYAGTIGDIGVFSLNVHKHIQCGEGGVIVTNETRLAMMLHNAINHGELDPKYPTLGLNLRMTEPIAAIACAQLKKARDIVAGRRAIGLELCDMVEDIPWIKPHKDQTGCKHVYYLWTALTRNGKRGEFVTRMNERGVPIRAKYAPLLHRLFNTGDQCPVVEHVDSRIVVFEVCAYDLSSGQMKTLREIFKQVAGDMHDTKAA